MPSSVSQLNKQPVRYLRAVLAHHGILTVGVKEELIIGIGLLKGAKKQAAFSRERRAILELILLLRELFVAEEKQDRECVLTRKRAYASEETSHMTTRQAASAKEDSTMPPENKHSHSITDALDVLEKKLLLEENQVQMQLNDVVNSKFKSAANLGSGPPAKRTKTVEKSLHGNARNDIGKSHRK